MRVWTEINLDNLKNNLDIVQEQIGSKSIIGIVKANAYGHGSLEITKQLQYEGISNFGVACVSEAIELRKNNINSNILILGCTPFEDIKTAIEYNIEITVSSFEEIEFLGKTKLSPIVHIKVDTGMGRIGFSLNKVEKAFKLLKENTNSIIKSVYSHFSSADNDEIFTNNQLNEFNKIKKIVDCENWHISNSAGIVNIENGYNFVRPGIILYGYLDFDSKINKMLKPVMSLKSKLLFIKTIEKRTPISYGKTYYAQPGEIIGTVSAGYADGIFRALSNKGKVKINNTFCDIVGNITMDQILIKIPRNISAKIGDTVTFFDESYTAKDIASLINTIPYEILTSISARVPRIYIQNNKIKSKISFLNRDIL